MTSRLTSTGLDVPTLADLLAQIDDDIVNGVPGFAGLGPDVRTALHSDGALGILRAIVADTALSLWETLQAVNASSSPNGATGAQLDALGQLTAITRAPATASTVTLHLTGTNGTSIAAGRRVRASSVPGIDWITQSTVVIGPSGVDVVAAASITGPVRADAGTLTSIVTPVSGWTGVTNAGDASPGANLESDPAFRVRRLASLFQPGAGVFEAIRTDVGNVSGVTEVEVYGNNGDATDSFSVPAHSVEAIVVGGDDAAIAAALFGSVAEGIGTFGTATPVTVTDSQGNAHTIKFSRASNVDVFAAVTVVVDSNYPSNGDTLVAEAIANAGGSTIGSTVVRSSFYGGVYAVPGVRNVTNLSLGLAANPTGEADLVMGHRERPIFNTAHVAVTRG